METETDFTYYLGIVFAIIMIVPPIITFIIVVIMNIIEWFENNFKK
jgi:hypothetical protein